MSPDSSDTFTPESFCSTPENRTPVLNAILRLRKARSSTLLAASSSAGTSRGSASTIVTSAPKDFQTLANSTPITPPPSTTTLSGTQSIVSAWSEVTTRPPMSRPGSERAYEPVARTTFLPVRVRSPTVTVVGEDSRPSPSTSVTWCALARPCRPL